MGQEVSAAVYSREDRQRYRQKVRTCLDVFARMLSEARFDADRRSFGLEIELTGAAAASSLHLEIRDGSGLLVAEELVDTLPAKPLLIAVTGYADQVPAELAREAEFDHLLAKPADPAALGDLIRAHPGPAPALKV